MNLLEEGVDTGKASPLQDLRVGDFVLPPDAKESAEAAQVEVVQLFGMSAVDCPGLTGVEKSGKYHCTVNLQLGGYAESSSLPYVLAKSSKCCTGFSNPVVISVTMFTALDSVLPR